MKEETFTDSYLENKTHPLVSVIIPFKNAEVTIADSIDSIINQSYSNLEIILVNDHASDSSIEIVKRYSDKRILLIDNHGIGIASALNTGLQHINGKYIARMDADDISHPNRIALQVDLLEGTLKIGVVSSLVNHIDSNNDQEGYRIYVDWLNQLVDPHDHYINRYVDATVAHPSVMFRCELVRDYGNYSTQPIPEDFELWLRWMQNGVRFAKVPQTLVDWYDLPGRASRELANYNQESFYKVKAEYFSKWWNKKSLKKEFWIWGYGKDVFRKSNHLLDHGLSITGYIDLHERKDSTRNVKSYKKIPGINGFYLVYISDRNGKALVKKYFDNCKMEAGKDFLFMS